MIEFIENCRIWLETNRAWIETCLTSANFATLIGLLIGAFRVFRKTKDNTAASNNLKTALDDNKRLAEDVKTLTTQNQTLIKNLATEKKANDEFKKEVLNLLDVTSVRFKSMIEVQSIVYSTIKDDAIRKTVNSILVNAKYAENSTRDKLQEEVETLKSVIHDKIKDVEDTVEQAVDNVKSITNTDYDETDNLVRY